MRVLLSIKPEYAYKIFNGEKKFEFRRTIFKNKAVKYVVVYASSPVKKVIGEFEIEAILSGDIDALWHQTKEYAGISEAYFYAYFKERKVGHAIKVKSFQVYKEPLCLQEHFSAVPPQSFIYLSS